PTAGSKENQHRRFRPQIFKDHLPETASFASREKSVRPSVTACRCGRVAALVPRGVARVKGHVCSVDRVSQLQRSRDEWQEGRLREEWQEGGLGVENHVNAVGGGALAKAVAEVTKLRMSREHHGQSEAVFADEGRKCDGGDGESLLHGLQHVPAGVDEDAPKS